MNNDYHAHQIFFFDNLHCGDWSVVLLSEVGHRLLHRLSFDVDVHVRTERQGHFESEKECQNYLESQILFFSFVENVYGPEWNCKRRFLHYFPVYEVVFVVNFFSTVNIILSSADKKLFNM